MGNASALGNLRGVSTDYLDAAMNEAGSALEYQRALSQVMNAVDQGIFAADTQVDFAQAQIDAIKHLADNQDAFRAEMAAYQQALVENSNAVNRFLSRVEGDGIPIRLLDGEVFPVEVTA
jgi:flagellin-like hook-associated protein FlgL